jgi:hypothetical protein
VSGSTGRPAAKRSPVVAATIETLKIHKPSELANGIFAQCSQKSFRILQVSFGNI